jgi:hypothetical protein
LLLIGCVLLALFFVHPGAKKIKSRIINSISLALGRPVDISSASFRLLPHPGFDLENFVVHDDPAFSAEPLLRAQDVTASLRLWSLLHGRLEIARLSLTDPSLNLVQNAAGHWNLEQLLQRAAQTSVAPTGKAKTEPRPAFPYIEADSGRINLKLGEEKKPYAITDADFSLWQESENSWGLRLEGKPVRTDFNLTNTGTIKLSGSWERASTLRETPLHFVLQWENGQLGQVTTLGYGNDKGWRGELSLVTQIDGSPEDLHVQANASVKDFRRYDVVVDSNLPLAAQCSAHYNYQEQALSGISCHAPVQDGFLSMDGSIDSLLAKRNYQLNFAAQDVPAQSLAAFLVHMQQGIPANISANGKLSAKVSLTTKANAQVWQGQGEIKEFGLATESANPVLASIVPFSIGAQSTGKTRDRVPALLAISAEPGIEVGPFNVSLGGSTPISIHGWVSPSDYNFRVKGDAQVQRLLQFARIFTIPSPQTSADGSATVDLALAGSWSNFSTARSTGTAQLRSVHAQLRGVNAPLEIASASISLSPEQVNVKKLSASIAGSTWQGTLTLPRPCAIQETCAAHFNLHTDELTDATLDSLLITPSQAGRWYSLLPENQSPSFLSRLRATGQLSIGNVELYKLTGTDFLANADLEAGNLKLANLHAKLLGGKHTGNLTISFISGVPIIHASGAFDRITLEKLADLMDDDWISGSADATYEFSGTGKSVAAILSSSSVELKVNGRDCTLPHITLGGDDPLRMQHFSTALLFGDGRFQIKQGIFETADGKYELNGTASLSRDIHFKLTRNDGPEFDIQGSLAQPRISASKSSGTRIALKP